MEAVKAVEGRGARGQGEQGLYVQSSREVATERSPLLPRSLAIPIP